MFTSDTVIQLANNPVGEISLNFEKGRTGGLLKN